MLRDDPSDDLSAVQPREEERGRSPWVSAVSSANLNRPIGLSLLETDPLQIFDQMTQVGEIVAAAGKAELGAVADVEEPTIERDEGDAVLAGPVQELLDADRCGEYLQAYLEEHQPVGPTEHSIVRELAHHAASMDLLNEAIGAIQRQGARELPEFARLAGETGSAVHDAVLAGTMSQEPLDRCEKRLRLHSRGFHRALDKLEELQARRKNAATGDQVVPPIPYVTEEACEAHLMERFQTGECRCPRCGAQEGHPIFSRRCWECAACGSQTGLRHGTIMANSPIPLIRWFTAIWLMLWRPTITTAEMVSRVGREEEGGERGVERASDPLRLLLAGCDRFHSEPRASARGPGCGLLAGWDRLRQIPSTKL